MSFRKVPFWSQSDTITNNHLLSSTTKNSSNDADTHDNNIYLDIYDMAKNHLREVAEYRTSFHLPRKENDIRNQIEDNISKYSKKAVDVHIVRGSISVRAKRFWHRLGNSKAQLLSKRNVSEFIY